MRGSVENGERGDIRYRDMQNVFSVQGDTLVIPLQSNFQVERTRNGVVCLGRLKNPGLVTLTAAVGEPGELYEAGYWDKYLRGG